MRSTPTPEMNPKHPGASRAHNHLGMTCLRSLHQRDSPDSLLFPRMAPLLAFLHACPPAPPHVCTCGPFLPQCSEQTPLKAHLPEELGSLPRKKARPSHYFLPFPSIICLIAPSLSDWPRLLNDPGYGLLYLQNISRESRACVCCLGCLMHREA